MKDNNINKKLFFRKEIIKMFGLEYIMAFIKVAFQIAFAIVSAIPFRIAWNAVVPVYFASYVPEQLHNISYWHFVGIILVFSFLGEQISKVTPRFLSQTSEQASEQVSKVTPRFFSRTIEKSKCKGGS